MKKTRGGRLQRSGFFWTLGAEELYPDGRSFFGEEEKNGFRKACYALDVLLRSFSWVTKQIKRREPKYGGDEMKK